MVLNPKDPRVGVFVCHCGHNIAGVVDVERVACEATELPGVVVGEVDLFCCSEPGQQKIREAIKSHDLDRVVVAACSPRLHGTTFMRVAEDAGLNPYLIRMTNIREQVSWVHTHLGDAATDKASELLRMAVSRVKLAEPLKKRRVKVRGEGVVVGGGVAGLTAALRMADAGARVVLVEREFHLGGRLKNSQVLLPGMEKTRCVLSPLISRAVAHPNIRVMTGAQVREATGSVGNFTLSIEVSGRAMSQGPGNPSPKNLADVESEDSLIDVETAAVVLATGFTSFDPAGDPRYPFAELADVVTTVQVEEMLNSEGPAARGLVRPSDGKSPKRVAFIQCVGSREEEGNRYCSKVCCLVTMKQARMILDRVPDASIHVHHRDVRVVKKGGEEFYRGLREAGVIFLRGPVKDVAADPSGVLRITSEAEDAGSLLVTEADLVVLSVGMEPSTGSEELRSVFKIPRGDDGFFLEAHPKLRPLETVVDGVFLAGACQGPRDASEAATSGAGAAGKALTILKKDILTLDARVAVIDEDLCIGCGVCATECPFGAVALFEEGEEEKARVNRDVCKGCGVCSGACPSGAAVSLGFTDQELMAEAEEALRHDPSRKIVAFMCNWCAYAGADFAGVARIQYPENVRIVRVMCSGRVSRSLVLDTLEKGAAAVLVAGCHPPGDCHYISGNLRARDRIMKLKKRMSRKGMDPDRVRLECISANQGAKLARVLEEMVDRFIGREEARVG